MNIEESTVKKLRLTDIEKLDPITVILEDPKRSHGKIIIECFGESWSSFWPAMGARTISEFFCSCDEHYLAKNLSNIKSHIDDYDGLAEKARKAIVKLRKNESLYKDEARDLFDKADNLGNDQHSLDQDSMQTIFGDEWWYVIPEKPNHEYEYLCRIINTVKEALKVEAI